MKPSASCKIHQKLFYIVIIFIAGGLFSPSYSYFISPELIYGASNNSETGKKAVAKKSTKKKTTTKKKSTSKKKAAAKKKSTSKKKTTAKKKSTSKKKTTTKKKSTSKKKATAKKKSSGKKKNVANKSSKNKNKSKNKSLDTTNTLASIEISPWRDLGIEKGPVCFKIKAYSNTDISSFSEPVCTYISDSENMKLTWLKGSDSIIGYQIYFGKTRKKVKTLFIDYYDI